MPSDAPRRPEPTGTLTDVFERFTDRARRVLTLAQEEARLLNHSFIGTEHILLALIREGDGLGAEALRSLGVSFETVREKVVELVGISGSVPGASPPFTPRAKKVLELALREALQYNHSYIGTEHILLGLVREGDGVAAHVLVGLGVDLYLVRQAVNDLITGGPEPQAGQSQEERPAASPQISQSRDASCPHCASLLVGAVRFRSMSIPADDENASPLTLDVVYCRYCGTTLQLLKPDTRG